MIINSILDNDLYKFTMQNAVIKHFPRAIVRYEFIDRNNMNYPDGFYKLLRKEVDTMKDLVLDEILLRKFAKVTRHYIDPSYFVFLRGYRFNPTEVEISMDKNKLKIVIEGPWYSTILWEVPLMALVSELYFKETSDFNIETNEKHAFEVIDKAGFKAAFIENNGLSVADFSTRRRASFASQKWAVDTMRKYLVGTSNVLLGLNMDLKLIGTHAHEWFMFMAAKYGYKMANSIALGKWADTYSGELGIALSDTYTTDVFLKSFDTFHAKLFDGVRQDSGNPIQFTDKIVKHYKDLGIDPMSKTIIFSDSLNVLKAAEIANHCKGKIRCSFGIGTNISNDIDMLKPLNIVIKMTAARPFNGHWIDTIKLSDTPGKHTGKLDEVEFAKTVLSRI